MPPGIVFRVSMNATNISDFLIRTVPAESTRALRKLVLRPDASPAELAYPGDDAESSFHLALYGSKKDPIGIASVYREEPPEAYLVECESRFHFDDDSKIDAPKYFRLRGMAVAEKYQGNGLGKQILDEAIKTLAIREAMESASANFVLWCNARTTALRFYEAFQFSVIGEEFEIKKIGPHYFLARSVSRGRPLIVDKL